jgi:hypothetical protein
MEMTYLLCFIFQDNLFGIFIGEGEMQESGNKNYQSIAKNELEYDKLDRT